MVGNSRVPGLLGVGTSISPLFGKSKTKTFSYTADDLKRWLRADPDHGSKFDFVLDKITALNHEFKVENLWARDFDGTNRGVFVDDSATSQAQAVEWATDALREWAGRGTGIGPSTKNHFGLLAREFAAAGARGKSTAMSCGETLDFVLLFSDHLSKNSNSQMLPLKSFNLHRMDLFNLYSWIFNNKWNPMSVPHAQALVNIQSAPGVGCPGLHQDYWDSLNGIHTDQTHHFAAYFYFGGKVSTGKTALHAALAVSGDWDLIHNKITNAGDYYLGFTGAREGEKFSAKPGFAGKAIEAVLLAPSPDKAAAPTTP